MTVRPQSAYCFRSLHTKGTGWKSPNLHNKIINKHEISILRGYNKILTSLVICHYFTILSCIFKSVILIQMHVKTDSIINNFLPR